jgi:hypothetical protein
MARDVLSAYRRRFILREPTTRVEPSRFVNQHLDESKEATRFPEVHKALIEMRRIEALGTKRTSCRVRW